MTSARSISISASPNTTQAGTLPGTSSTTTRPTPSRRSTRPCASPPSPRSMTPTATCSSSTVSTPRRRRHPSTRPATTSPSPCKPRSASSPPPRSSSTEGSVHSEPRWVSRCEPFRILAPCTRISRLGPTDDRNPESRGPNRARLCLCCRGLHRSIQQCHSPPQSSRLRPRRKPRLHPLALRYLLRGLLRAPSARPRRHSRLLLLGSSLAHAASPALSRLSIQLRAASLLPRCGSPPSLELAGRNRPLRHPRRVPHPARLAPRRTPLRLGVGRAHRRRTLRHQRHQPSVRHPRRAGQCRHRIAARPRRTRPRPPARSPRRGVCQLGRRPHQVPSTALRPSFHLRSTPLASLAPRLHGCTCSRLRQLRCDASADLLPAHRGGRPAHRQRSALSA